MTSTSVLDAKPAAPAADGSAPLRRREIARALAAAAALLLLAAAWRWTPLGDMVQPSRVSAWLGPYRDAWYALPAVVAAFVVLGFLMVPAMGMVVVCGLVFGPWLGTLYAMAGSHASAVAGFAAGRKLGRRTLERVLGRRVGALIDKIANDGVIAIYVIRKIPAPFTLVNLAIGASGVRFLDFLTGTVLGMGPIVVVLSVGAGRLPELMADPTPRAVALLAALLLVPFLVAVSVNAARKRRRRAAGC